MRTPQKGPQSNTFFKALILKTPIFMIVRTTKQNHGSLYSAPN